MMADVECRYIEAMCPGARAGDYIDDIDPNAMPAPKPYHGRLRPGAPWFNDEIKKEKLLKRKVYIYIYIYIYKKSRAIYHKSMGCGNFWPLGLRNT